MPEIREGSDPEVDTDGSSPGLEKGFRGNPTGPFDMDRVNVSGSSVAIGHPWSGTGGRILTTLAYEMARRDVKHGLISICAAGAMAGAVLLERN